MLTNRLDVPMRKKAAKPLSTEDVLRSVGIIFDRLEDVPAKVIREAMRHVPSLSNFRSIELPPAIIMASLKEPLLRDLLGHDRSLGDSRSWPVSSLSQRIW